MQMHILGVCFDRRRPASRMNIRSLVQGGAKSQLEDQAVDSR